MVTAPLLTRKDQLTKVNGWMICKTGTVAKHGANYVMGKKKGKGRYEWQDGSYYEGDFEDSMFQGEGKFY